LSIDLNQPNYNIIVAGANPIRSFLGASLSRLLSVLLFCFVLVQCQAQDIHFSQFYLTDISTNPGAVGDFDGDYRLSGAHRNQWKSITAPFSTFQFTADAKNAFEKRNLGLGLRLFNDRAGDSKLNTFSVALLASGITSLNPDSSLTLHSGIQVGYTQQRLDYSQLRFDAQYSGFIYDPLLFNGEADAGNSVSHLDVHVGMYIRKKIDRNRSWSLGISAWNLSTPDVNFKSDEAVKLDQRIAFHGDYTYRVSRDWDVIPAGRAMIQGTYEEFIIGARIRHTWQYDAMVKRRIYLGGFSRMRDSALLSLGLEHDAWTAGLSYDINLSALEVASRNRGAFELVVTYVFDVFNEKRVLHRNCLDLL
jgi:type IX secretion system PorP/SprF family membrane protein